MTRTLLAYSPLFCQRCVERQEARMVMWVLSFLAGAIALVDAGGVLRANNNNVGQTVVVPSFASGLNKAGPVVAQSPRGVVPFTAAANDGALGGNFVDDVFGGSGLGSGRKNVGFGAPSFGRSSFGGFGTSDIFGGRDVAASRQGSDFGELNQDTGAFQRGTAQVSILDQAAQQGDRRDDRFARDFAAQQQGAGRSDNQERRGDLKEVEQEAEQEQEAFRGQKQQENFNQQAGLWNSDSRRQNDQEAKIGTLLSSDGELLRSDFESNDGGKALGVRKTAFTNGNLGFENIGYNFDKDFDQQANERGGYKEVTGRDDNNVQIYQEKQRDHRFSNSDNEAVKRSDDLSRNANSNKWLQNALQKQGQRSQYGAADKIQDAAAKQAEDFKTFFDKRDDRIWNGARSRDNAFRGAEDNAAKNGLFNKDAIAKSSGRKGVADSKYYGGAESGSGVVAGARPGSGRVPYGYGTAGVVDQSPKVALALQGSAPGSVAVAGRPNPNVRGRLERSGGDALNAYRENAIQGDLANHLSNNAAQSRADARNNYLRDRGVQDSIQANKANQGKWANQREGFRDNRQQGFNGDDANAARAGEAKDNSFSDSVSSSNLESAEKGLDQAKLDRINLKRNQVESNQNIRSKKQFYHDKNQGGFNNEGLNYNRNRGNNDFGAQEAAEKEAKTRFSNLAQDSKNSRGQRRYDDQDARKISNADAVFKRQNANTGAAAAFARAADQARNQARGFKRARGREEFDRFGQLNNQRNQKQWDRLNRDLLARNNGKNVGRRVDGAFQYQNVPSNRRVAFGSSDDSAKLLGTRAFGKAPLGKVEGGFDPYAPVQTVARPAAPATVQGSKQVIENVGKGVGQTQFGTYW